ncbi:OmpA family protein [Roseibaca sp. V10]|uniref:OmpA family protein n=1 Tax=Roseinatronobacter domitianus TaxID=2940293 RepID=A0ABT0M3I0_9RHOB|nr:OmpA family protein [Roseibaca domitiana]MCL1629203.1 OmpA family protein [Roseibaca domitiana]
MYANRFKAMAGGVLLSAFVSAPFGVLAEGTPYSQEQIVQALIASVDLGAARAVCIGTKADCAEPSQGLDMRVGFDFDSDVLDPSAQDALKIFAAALRDPRLDQAVFKVEGHTDAIGSEIYNLDLSERRARAVHDFLLEQGLPQARLDAVGLGQSTPRVADPRDAANRRVELHAVLR